MESNKKLSRNSIWARLTLAFGAALAALAVVAGLGLWQLRELSHAVALLVTQSAPRFETMHALDALIHTVSQRAAMAFVMDDRDEIAKELKAIDVEKARIGQLLETLDTQMAGSGDAARKLQEQIQSDNGALLVALTKFSRALAGDKRDFARKTLFAEVTPRRDAMANTLNAYHGFELARFTGLHDDVTQGYKRSFLSMGVVALTALAAVLFLGWRIARGITVPLGQAVQVATAISGGRLDSVIAPQGCDETVRLLGTLQVMQRNLEERIDSDRVALQKTARIQQALDSADTSVLIADAEGAIIHLNTTLLDTLGKAEADLRKDLPTLRVSDLPGQHYEVLHKDPRYWRAVVDGLKGPHCEKIVLGGRHFDVVASPIVDAEGARIGSVFGWTEFTEQVAVEAEIAAILQVAVEGDFSKRIDMAGKRGFLRDLSMAVNRLIEVSERGFADLGGVLKTLAEGDLTRRIESEYTGKFGELKDNANRSAEQLAHMVSEIRMASEAIAAASAEITEGNADLSQRTQAQAANLEKTAASMERLTGTVRQNADNAEQANRLAVSASSIAAEGGKVVGDVVSTMQGITASSRKIEDIIGVIDDIAFQTNILALNAAVEAARAGDQGRGFAVVANEVRNLAQRSSAAAREIKDLIVDSVNKVDAGSKLVDDAGKTMDELVKSVRRVAGIIGEITVASQEQSAGIVQVNDAIAQMDHVTQQNAALVEEAASAAESMEGQARVLIDSVAAFQLAPAASPGRGAHALREAA